MKIQINLSTMIGSYKKANEMPGMLRAKWSVWLKRVGQEAVESGRVDAIDWLYAAKTMGWEIGVRSSLIHWHDGSVKFRDYFFSAVAFMNVFKQKVDSRMTDYLLPEQKELVLQKEKEVRNRKTSELVCEVELSEWLEKTYGCHQVIREAALRPVVSYMLTYPEKTTEVMQKMKDLACIGYPTERCLASMNALSIAYVEQISWAGWQAERERWLSCFRETDRNKIKEDNDSYLFGRGAVVGMEVEERVYWAQRLNAGWVPMPKLSVEKVTSHVSQTKERDVMYAYWSCIESMPGVEHKEDVLKALLNKWLEWVRLKVEAHTVLFHEEDVWTGPTTRNQKKSALLKGLLYSDHAQFFVDWLASEARECLRNQHVQHDAKEVFGVNCGLRSDAFFPIERKRAWYDRCDDGDKQKIQKAVKLSLIKVMSTEKVFEGQWLYQFLKELTEIERVGALQALHVAYGGQGGKLEKLESYLLTQETGCIEGNNQRKRSVL